MHLRQFETYGSERKKLKKQLFKLKHIEKHFWYNFNMENDLRNIHGCEEANRGKADEFYQELIKEIAELESKLSVRIGYNQ